MKYFTINELCASETARRKGIKNEPTSEIVEHLTEVGNFIDGLREEWGAPIKVTSGYRCPELNKAVGGSSTSAHMRGFAVDLQPTKSYLFDSFKRCAAGWIRDKKYDQFIIEKSGKTQWLHIGLYNSKGQQRCQNKVIIL